MPLRIALASCVFISNNACPPDLETLRTTDPPVAVSMASSPARAASRVLSVARYPIVTNAFTTSLSAIGLGAALAMTLNASLVSSALAPMTSCALVALSW